MTTKEKIQLAIDKVPNLTDFGIGLSGINKRLPLSEQKKKLKEEQAHLFQNEKEFEQVCDWLQSVEKTNNIYKVMTSYGLKHLAEKTIGYSSNGIFIAAAIYSGFEIEINEDSPNAYFNMSEQSLKLKDPYYNVN